MLLTIFLLWIIAIVGFIYIFNKENYTADMMGWAIVITLLTTVVAIAMSINYILEL